MSLFYKVIGILIFSTSLLCYGRMPAPSPTNALLAEHPEAETFINEMVQKHQFDKKQLTHWLTSAKIKPNIIEAMQKPYEALPWYRYKKLFITDRNIKEGVNFWKAHQTDLERAQNQFGVPPEIIIAIIGVETKYGKNKGHHNVLDALVTLSFYYPKRAEFFRTELEQFLLLTREENLDPHSIVGSYAGAFGEPQFMPSSYRNYAVDFSNDGKKDIISNSTDAIGSVANYFKAHGWQKGKQIVRPTDIQDKAYQNFPNKDSNPKPTLTLQELIDRGVILNPDLASNPLDPKTPVSLIELEDETQKLYWLGLKNFYVITRYNHSNHYAMAVYQLSEALKNSYLQQEGPLS